ncbi:response regulator [Brevibacillus fluminis]|uniref:Response regulator n=1 Tax=Brevibacillus fluminis TaxID=511487 RepID=A0A3M8DYA9_9BACL|nr:response regulator [Brevibacillus fluminis]RNB91967.1 response regulator [Brevibacillus fluminis]
MKTVMIVDDAGFTRSILRTIIESLGFTVVTEAKSGEEAIMLYRMYRPDLITMDISMPGMDGLAALEKIMEIDQQAKVIICTARGQKDLIVRAISVGAIDYVVKPLQRDRLELSIQKIATRC